MRASLSSKDLLMAAWFASWVLIKATDSDNLATTSTSAGVVDGEAIDASGMGLGGTRVEVGGNAGAYGEPE